MNNKNLFIMAGVLAIGIYLIICFFCIFYIFSTNYKPINFTPNITAIELEMIEDLSAKKLVQKKVDKIIENEEEIEQESSASSKKKPDLKSLFAKVEETSQNIPSIDVNNIQKSIDPKKFKSNFEKEKKSDNVKIDNLLIDEKTTANSKIKSASTGDKQDEYLTKVYELLYSGAPVTKNTKLVSKIIITIDKNGNFNFSFKQYSGDANYDASLKLYLEQQKSIPYPIPPNGKVVKYSVDFKFEG